MLAINQHSCAGQSCSAAVASILDSDPGDVLLATQEVGSPILTNSSLGVTESALLVVNSVLSEIFSRAVVASLLGFLESHLLLRLDVVDTVPICTSALLGLILGALHLAFLVLDLTELTEVVATIALATVLQAEVLELLGLRRLEACIWGQLTEEFLQISRL